MPCTDNLPRIQAALATARKLGLPAALIEEGVAAEKAAQREAAARAKWNEDLYSVEAVHDKQRSGRLFFLSYKQQDCNDGAVMMLRDLLMKEGDSAWCAPRPRP